jgi:hypothetical protein
MSDLLQPTELTQLTALESTITILSPAGKGNENGTLQLSKGGMKASS